MQERKSVSLIKLTVQVAQLPKMKPFSYLLKAILNSSRAIQHPNPQQWIFPLISIVNKSCNNERCVDTVLPIIQNLIVSQGLELILSMCRSTTMSDQRTLI